MDESDKEVFLRRSYFSFCSADPSYPNCSFSVLFSCCFRLAHSYPISDEALFNFYFFSFSFFDLRSL